MKSLSTKQKRFVVEYLVDANATHAAIRAGYSAKTAHSLGYELMRTPEVSRAIADEQKARAERTGIRADRVLEELALIAYSDIGAVVRVDEHGRVCVRSLDELPPEVRRCIESVKQVTAEVTGEDGRVVEKVQLSVKLHSKVAALGMLVKHLGLEAPQKHEVKVEFSWADLVAKAAEGADGH